MEGLAQLVSASGCGPEGRGFESHISPQKKSTSAKADVLFFSYIRLAVHEKYTLNRRFSLTFGEKRAIISVFEIIYSHHLIQLFRRGTS